MKMETFASHPVIKVGLYLFVLVLFEFVAQAEKIDNAMLATMTWWDWLKFFASILAPAILLVRVYSDQSLQRYITNKQIDLVKPGSLL